MPPTHPNSTSPPNGHLVPQASTGDADAAVQRAVGENLSLHARAQQLEGALAAVRSDAATNAADHRAAEERCAAIAALLSRIIKKPVSF